MQIKDLNEKISDSKDSSPEITLPHAEQTPSEVPDLSHLHLDTPEPENAHQDAISEDDSSDSEDFYIIKVKIPKNRGPGGHDGHLHKGEPGRGKHHHHRSYSPPGWAGFKHDKHLHHGQGRHHGAPRSDGPHHHHGQRDRDHGPRERNFYQHPFGMPPPHPHEHKPHPDGPGCGPHEGPEAPRGGSRPFQHGPFANPSEFDGRHAPPMRGRGGFRGFGCRGRGGHPGMSPFDHCHVPPRFDEHDRFRGDNGPPENHFGHRSLFAGRGHGFRGGFGGMNRHHYFHGQNDQMSVM